MTNEKEKINAVSRHLNYFKQKSKSDQLLQKATLLPLDKAMTYAQQIQSIFNNKILGDEDDPAQWCLPMNEVGKNVGVICLDNNRVRKIIANFDILATVFITKNSRLIKYQYCISHYRTGMLLSFNNEQNLPMKISDSSSTI